MDEMTYAQEHRAKNPEAYRDATRRYRAAHPERARALKAAAYQRRQAALKSNPEEYAKAREAKRIQEAAWRERNGDLYKAKAALDYVKRKYKLSTADAQKMIDLRSGGCEVCGSCIRPHIDHNHATGAVRGILCQDCNLALGRMKDNPEMLEKLAGYARQYASAPLASELG